MSVIYRVFETRAARSAHGFLKARQMSKRKRSRSTDVAFTLNPDHPLNKTVFTLAKCFDLSPGAATLWGVLLLDMDEGMTVRELMRFTPTALNWDIPELASKA